MLPRAARPEGPERLPALRPAAAGSRALKPRLAAIAVAAALLVSGCGGDDDERAETTPTLPELTIPTVETTAPPPTTPAPEPIVPPEQTETLPPDGDGGTPAPTPEPPPDSPENDTPPPADSPAERFEEFCDENPGACG